jgi:hypothetical protein
MEEMSETEVLVRINKLKLRHELLKQELMDHITHIEEKEKELDSIESEYVQLIQKIAP